MLEIKNISKTYNIGTENEIKIFKNLTINVKKGEILALLGPNGCGKTTLFNIISGAVIKDAGHIILNKQKISDQKESERSKYIAKVYQDPSKGVSNSLTVLENIAIADKKGERSTLKKLIQKNRIGHYKEILQRFDNGLENRMNIKVKYLSGGQRQTLALLMATLKNPELLLLDEHTAALDPKTSEVILKKTIEVIHEFKITTIMISHNIRDAIQYSDRIIMLNNGNITLDVKSKDIVEEELIKIYNKEVY